MKYLITLSLLFIYCNLNAQDSSKVVRTTSRIVSLQGSMIPKLDTNLVYYNEKGKALRYYQYDKMFRTGMYRLVPSSDRSLPQKMVITKMSEEEFNKFNTLIRESIKIKTPYIYEGKKLDLAPLTAFYEQEKLQNKVIVQIYWYASCGTCTENFAEISTFVKELGDPKDLLILAITTDINDVAAKKLKEQPLRNAELISSGRAISDAYQLTRYPIYIVSDRNQIIKYAVVGSSRLTIPDLKTAIKAALNK
ncbi:TlpA family protein disulfide reductase [Pedobacter psychrodurus]|uniref:TlpA family protein disulfide reductase n=1 Tax=Pedobacter psychrodurus TaxID=2530456 RepID=UPI002931DA10|nr:redoxin family protein [Pedobacter psychrodurus]